MDGMVHWTVQTLPVMTEVEQPPGGAAIVTSAGLVPYINISNTCTSLNLDVQINTLTFTALF